MADQDDIDPSGPDILAGEYALGVLEGDELAVARRLFLADRDFAERVRWWELIIARSAEAAGEYEPSTDVWPAIERRLPTLSDRTPGRLQAATPQTGKSSSRWTVGWAMAGAAAAAAVLTAIVIQPAGGPPTSSVETAAPMGGDRLIAQLQSEDGVLSLAGYVDPQAGQLAINISGFTPGQGQASELWVVPAGGAPQSLGLIPESGTLQRELTESERAALVDGASLAVTYEDATSAPHDAPSTDILLIGGLSKV